MKNVDLKEPFDIASNNFAQSYLSEIPCHACIYKNDFLGGGGVTLTVNVPVMEPLLSYPECVMRSGDCNFLSLLERYVLILSSA